MFKRILFIFFLANILFAHSSYASDRDYISSRSYLEDASNSLSFAEIKAKPFTVYNDILAKGYSQSTFWVKLKIAAAPELSSQHKNIFLRIEPGYLDEIELFDPLDPEKTNRFAGDRHSWNEYEYKSLLFNFVIPASNEPREVWLRLKTHSTNMMYVRAFDTEGLQNKDQQFQMLSELLVLSSLMFVLWGILIYSLSKDFLIAVFTVKQLVGFFFVASYVGLFRLFFSDYLSGPSLDILSNILIWLVTLTTVIFHYVFLKDYKPKRWGVVILKAMAFASVAELILVIAGHLTLALQLNMGVISLIGPVLLLIVLYGIDWSVLTNLPSVMTKRMLIIFHGLYLVLSLITALPSLGFKPLTNLAPHVAMIYWFMVGTLTILMLQFRNKRMYEEQKLLATLAKQESEFEKKRREQEKRFLEMLTHEIKTPLSVIKMASTSKAGMEQFKEHVVTAVTDINQLIEMCIATDKFESDQYKTKLEEICFLEFTQKIVANYSASAKFDVQIKEEIALKTDTQLLEIVLTNLIENAIKYGKKKSPIMISAKQNDKGDTSFTVSNALSHKGPLDTKKIFNKYYRGELAYEKSGSGLGLYLVKNLLQLLKGSISCKSDETDVEFIVKLPKQV